MDLPKDISINDLLLKVSPTLAKEMMAASGAVANLSGTAFSLVVDVSGDKYSYVVKNGTDFDVSKGDLDSPLITIKIAAEDLLKMVADNTMDLFFGVLGDLNKEKYDAIVGVTGSATMALTNNDGSRIPITIILNGAASPQAILKMKMADSIAVVNKETSPVHLFMSGKLQIDGDMGFALQIQPLFG